MKKIISVFLALCFVFSMFCLPVGATFADQTSTAYIQVGTTAHDLQAYGVHTFTSYYVNTAPTMDGRISAGEYNSGNVPSDVATIGNGLSLTNNLATSDYTDEYGQDYQDFTVKSYLSYDDTYAYIAEEVTTTKGIDLSVNPILNANVRYGLSQSANVPEAHARLSNGYSYVFDGTGFTVRPLASADRTYKKLDGAVTTTVQPDVDPYNDGTTEWTRAEYSKAENTAVSYTNNGGTHTYVFEYRIPLAEVIYSSTGRYSKEDVATLIQNDGFYGSYLFQVAVTREGGEDMDQQFFLTTGFAANKALAPYSGNEKSEESTWGQAVKEYWTCKNGDYLSVAYIASPVIHGGKTTQGPSVPASTGFRPGLSGYGLGNIKTAYKTGTTATFTVIPDAVDNTAPATGDIRVVPTKFRVRNGFDTKITGTFQSDYKTATFDTSKLPIGLSTLVVTFTQQRFDGTNWVDTGITKNLSRNFTVSSTVQDASAGASQTGDTLMVAIIIGSALLVVGAVSVVVVYRRKKSF